MSSVDLIKTPAWQGLTPGLPETVELTAAEAEHILGAAGLSGRLNGLAMSAGELSHYRVQLASGRTLFLKIAKSSQREVVERAEAIAGWLAERGVSVAAPLPGYPRTLADGRVAVVTEFIEGRRVRADASDLAALGTLIAQFHRTLAGHPDRPVWIGATKARLDDLNQIRADLTSGGLRSGPEPERLRELAADGDLVFQEGDGPAVPLHGDLNPGNVLVDLKTARPTLLDFEDVFHSVLPLIFELLLIVERFILVRIEADQEAAPLARTFLETYRSAAGPIASLAQRLPSDLLRSLALRSLCVLALGEQSGIAIANAEWMKFFTLEQLARRRSGLIDKIFADACR